MGRYDNESMNYSTPNMRQKDFVLSSNEFIFIQSKTDGQIKTYSGPLVGTTSAQEAMVIFDEKTKSFKETSNFDEARQLFTSAPESWYVVLKNPAKDNMHPEPAKPVNSPRLQIGKKINIAGPCSFSLYPGQMAKVVQGHRLRSNQYLVARVYDAEAASKSTATIVDADGKEVKKQQEKYFVGQLLIIKGTEVSFYIPPTGIEVIADKNKYIRNAVTLERLEYAILKGEDGEKRYVHGPVVVFPEPTETFVTTPKGGNIFRALELSPISGIYVKVIAAYDEEKHGKTIHHPIGEELFITGKDQMIYYPRPEHAMIQYDGRYMHHATCIPAGEGRYVLNRLTGDIRTVVGPAMLLPDPRTEVIVKRKLSPREVMLFYPGNAEALKYNQELTEKAMESAARKGLVNASAETLNSVYSTSNQESTLAIFEANANISRGTSYTKPRTITLDTKYEGVVSIDVWTGYAVNKVNKEGKRNIVVGPCTVLLDYDETLQVINNEEGKSDVFLKVKDSHFETEIFAKTSDKVDSRIKIKYTVNYLSDQKSKWFNINDHKTFISEKVRNKVKQEVQKHTVEDFYNNGYKILKTAVLGEKSTYTINEVGVVINTLEIIDISFNAEIVNMLNKNRKEIIKNQLDLSTAESLRENTIKLAEFAKEEADLKYQNDIYAIDLKEKADLARLEAEAAIEKKKRAEEEARTQAKKDIKAVELLIQDLQLEQNKKEDAARLEAEKAIADLEKVRQQAYANTVKEIMESISPQLVAALTTKANADILTTGMETMAPYALAGGESIAEVTTRLLRGTPLEELANTLNKSVTID